MNDMGTEATVVHVAHQHREQLCGIHLIWTHEGDSEVVVGCPSCAEDFCVVHLEMMTQPFVDREFDTTTTPHLNGKQLLALLVTLLKRG